MGPSDVLLRLFILLTIVPLVEVAILIRISAWIGWVPTLALVVVTGALGAFLARREGVRVLLRIQDAMRDGVPPTDAMVDGALIVAAAIVLVTPGVLTDAVGFALLIPPCRGWIKRRLAAAFQRHVVPMDHGHHAPFIDVEATARDANDTNTPV